MLRTLKVTVRLYYTDPAVLAFDAEVTRALEHEGRPAVVLDRTAFYPSSGGQPFDIGRLGDADVLDVVDQEHEIVHVLSTPLPSGARVAGQIDAARRLDHMQQHTGQHVLSAAFDRLFANETVSFHMGAEVSTIDLAKPVTWNDAAQAIDVANGIVWENRPVSIRFVSASEAAALPLRKDPARGGEIRLIEVDDFDLSACGGTHVSRTGAIGIVAALTIDKLRGGARVTFVCGRRALRTLDTYREAVSGSARVLSVLPQELPSAIGRLHDEGRELRKALTRAQARLAQLEGERLARDAEPIGNVRLVARVIEGWDVAGLKMLASAVASQEGVVAVLVSAARPASVVIARGAGVAADAGELLRALVTKFGGRGGGKQDIAQGGGFDADPEAIVSAARERVGS